MKHFLLFFLGLLLCVSVSAQSSTEKFPAFPSEEPVYVSLAEADISIPTTLASPEVQQVRDEALLLERRPDRIAASILAILLGGLGVQHFYTGQTLRGVLDILFCWTGIPEIIGLVEGIVWLCEGEEAWDERVERWQRGYLFD